MAAAQQLGVRVWPDECGGLGGGGAREPISASVTAGSSNSQR